MKAKAVAVLSSRVRTCKLHHPHAGTWAGSILQLGWSVDSPRQGKYVPGTLASMTTLCMVKHVRTMNSRKDITQNTDPRRTATLSGRLRCTGCIGRPGESKWGEICPAQDKKKDNCRPQGKQTEYWNWKPLSSWNSHCAVSLILSKAAFKSVKLTLS